jgi:hypothetical protein
MAKREQSSNEFATGHSDKTLEGMITPQGDAWKIERSS